MCSGFSPYTADNTATGGGDGARGWRTRCALATCLNSRMHLRRRRNTPLPTRATAGGGVRAHSTTALGLSMASSASSAAVAVCSVVARPRFFAHMREPSARFLSGYSLSPYLHIFSSRKNMLAVSPTSPILATSSSLVFSFHDSPVSSFSQLRLGNHAKTCWPFHADFADSRRTLASRHVGQDRRSAAVLWFERLLLLRVASENQRLTRQHVPSSATQAPKFFVAPKM